MNCPRCRALIPVDDVNLEHLLAKCRQCQEVFRFSVEEIEAVTDRVRENEPLPKASGRENEPLLDISLHKIRAPQPPNYRIEVSGHRRRIVSRWFEYRHLGMLMFCVFWDGFLVVWYTIAFSINGPWLMVIFPLIHVAVGVCLTYATLAGLLNQTVIAIDDGTLAITHGPVPWVGGLRVPAMAITQIYCTAIPLNRWRMTGANYGFIDPVQVRALLENGEQRMLFNTLPKEEGLFIEQVLEEWLKIKPRRVPGQVD